ncbi:MAG: hypothetical protein WCG09_07290 [Halobacteriota archaeon]
MDHTALDERPAELGISIPQGTLSGGQRKAAFRAPRFLKKKYG